MEMIWWSNKSTYYRKCHVCKYFESTVSDTISYLWHVKMVVRSAMMHYSSLEEKRDPIEDSECLKERKWWCFLLSSIFTFLLGIFLVLFVRVFASLFCRKVRLSVIIWPAEFRKGYFVTLLGIFQTLAGHFF